ncbi:hypothetical protein MHYP_G00090700 [Metynnis hypsauchen]
MKRAASPEPSCVSMMRHQYMTQPLNFSSEGRTSASCRTEPQRAGSLDLSCVPMNSDWSMEKPNFSSGPLPPDLKLQKSRAESPEPSCVSMKSDSSMFSPPKFSTESGIDPRAMQQKSPPHNTDDGLPEKMCVGWQRRNRLSRSRKRHHGASFLQNELEDKNSEISASSAQQTDGDRSFEKHVHFSGGIVPTDLKPLQSRAESPEPSCVSMSMKSNNSMFSSPEFSTGTGIDPRVPEPSSVSVISNSTFSSPGFSTGGTDVDPSGGRDTVLQDQSKCGACQQLLIDPASVSRRQCNSSYCDWSAQSGDLACPQSRKISTTYPVPNPHVMESTKQDLYPPEEVLDELNLMKYNTSREGYMRLIPAVNNCSKALLAGCNLSMNSCETLCSVLKSQSSSLKELDLSNNDLQDSGVELLCAGLSSLNCKLEILRLSGCMVTEKGCSSLASALSSNPSHLKQLDLTYNDPGESGVKLLSARLEDPRCALSTLRLEHAGSIRMKPGLRKYSCELTLDPNTAQACLSLSERNRKFAERSSDISALDSLGSCISSPAVFCMKRNTYMMESHDTSGVGGLSASDSFTVSQSASLSDSPAVSFTLSQSELDLSNNDLQDSLELLCDGLRSSNCKLQILRLSGCNLGEKACENLKSVLLMENTLKELDLSKNDLQDAGVEKLSAGLKSSHCKLQVLRLSGCSLAEEACENLKSALLSENSSLKELDLSNNDLQDSGVEKLCAGLKSPHCKLQILRLSGCMVTEVGCSSLASALSSNHSNLKELDLTYNHPGESGVKLLSARLEDPHCSLNTLRVEHGGKMRIKPGLKKYSYRFTPSISSTPGRDDGFLESGVRTVPLFLHGSKF